MPRRRCPTRAPWPTGALSPHHPARRRGDPLLVATAADDARTRVEKWATRVPDWTAEAETLVQRIEIKDRRVTVDAERELVAGRAPGRLLVHPRLVVVPKDHPVAT